ncbi:hypothetical protein CEXT_373441 [Caerostris extrusa]|uniref:Uncharacterized protein n=1 Tax=Caerostris extrusa TaxID=172846 RepID=A0AAV4S6S6_CAEEX|nr:hypothetical protein CEXT_373441 [Caerostris extrusa]
MVKFEDNVANFLVILNLLRNCPPDSWLSDNALCCLFHLIDTNIGSCLYRSQVHGEEETRKTSDKDCATQVRTSSVFRIRRLGEKQERLYPANVQR